MQPEAVIFSVRWLLYPINVGLSMALIAYLFRFVQEVCELLLRDTESDDLFLASLIDLMDKATIMALVIVVIMGGHQIYIRRFKNAKSEDRPQWLDHIDTIMLKVKIGLAFTSVSSVQLLKDFLHEKGQKPEILYQHVGLHLVFLLSTFIVALIWRLMHPQKHS